MKRIAIFGSTGSIGRQTLEVIERHPSRFCATGLTAGSNVSLLAEQVRKTEARVAWLPDSGRADVLNDALKASGAPECKVLKGPDSLREFLELAAPDVVVSAIAGRAGLYPTYLAVERGYDTALANKESLVMAGGLIMGLAKRKGARIIPMDSEHSAIWQCLTGEDPNRVKRIILTASGGPFRNDTIDQIVQRTFEETQKHPVWRMGEKINVDSATLMNKGLEMIEACVLFEQPPERVEVAIHPQCIVHSMVEFVDGSIKAQLGIPDMRLPIQYAMSPDERLDAPIRAVTLEDLSVLSFHAVDEKRFECLSLAYEAARAGGSMPAVMSVADEVAIQHFKSGSIGFSDVASVIRATMEDHETFDVSDLEAVLSAASWAEKRAGQHAELIAKKS